jgi:hypothetical protein
MLLISKKVPCAHCMWYLANSVNQIIGMKQGNYLEPTNLGILKSLFKDLQMQHILDNSGGQLNLSLSKISSFLTCNDTNLDGSRFSQCLLPSIFQYYPPHVSGHWARLNLFVCDNFHPCLPFSYCINSQVVCVFFFFWVKLPRNSPRKMIIQKKGKT